MSLHYQHVMTHNPRVPMSRMGPMPGQGMYSHSHAHYSPASYSNHSTPRGRIATGTPSGSVRGAHAIESYSSPAQRTTPVPDHMTPRINADSQLQGDADKFGVGIQFDSSSLKVKALVRGYAADRADTINVRDELVAVNGTALTDSKQARLLLLGRQGSVATITFRRHTEIYELSLVRGTPEYLEIVDKARSLHAQVTELREQNSKANDSLAILSSVTKSPTGARDMLRQRSLDAQDWLDRLKELEQRNAVLSQENQSKEIISQELTQAKEKLTNLGSENQVLKHQLTSLQKLLGEKDGWIAQTKAKAREQQSNLLTRIRELEDALKDRVAAKNATISELQKQVVELSERLTHSRQSNNSPYFSPSLASTTVPEMNGLAMEGRYSQAQSGLPDRQEPTNSPISMSPLSGIVEIKSEEPQHSSRQQIVPKPPAQFGIHPNSRNQDSLTNSSFATTKPPLQARDRVPLHSTSNQAVKPVHHAEVDVHVSSRPGPAKFSQTLNYGSSVNSNVLGINSGLQGYQGYPPQQSQIYPVPSWQQRRW